ncbi:VWA domain-containing protein [Litorivivens sp.]|uniref:vWA domain-containing protein n=1 Tax=Litorivivens sp. TaxID=2020868 RepID=UPI0035621019
MRRRRRETEVFGLSFLDAISCGFGAIVLLLVLTKIAEPTKIVEQGIGLQAMAEKLAAELPQLDAKLESLEQKLAAEGKRLSEAEQTLASMRPQARALEAERADAQLEAEAASAIENRLALARQQLTDEMKRLYASGARRPSDSVGGIPVDSEYIIFVIDTSGSMHGYAWPTVIKKMTETLDLYPKVKGLQIMNDMGDYMFSQYAGDWIPDTPGRRKAIISRMASWQPFSNSSPVEGITRAIRAFYAEDKKISIYVFGDEFTGNSIQSVLDTVARINPRGSDGKPQVRIHAVGFPVQFARNGIRPTGVRFAMLMRALCQQNGGTFVGLQTLEQ